MATDLERTIYTCEKILAGSRPSCTMLRECNIVLMRDAHERSTPKGHAAAAKRVAKAAYAASKQACAGRIGPFDGLGACPCEGLKGTKRRRKASKKRRK